MTRRGHPRGLQIPRGPSFWLLAVLLSLFLFAATAPSPLYGVYAERFGFSSITITALYAVYAPGALIALLVGGRLSDHVGRRPVVVATLVVQIAGMIAFITADSVGLLYAGRILQGVATGLASGAISAWILDLHPPGNPTFAGLVAGVALIAGLGAGAIGSALLVQYAPDPLRLVFWVLAAIYFLAVVVVLFIPDMLGRTSGALGSMRPRVAVPPAARSTFGALVPSLMAIWALAGLYASLGPSLIAALLETRNRVPGGLLITTLLGAGAVASAVVPRTAPRITVIVGSLVLVVGVSLTLLGVWLASATWLYAGSFVAGLGFGPAHSGIVRSVAPLASPDERGALLGALYMAIYVSFSIPTVVAGIAVTRFPLVETTYVYGTAVIALAAITTIATWRTKWGGEL